MNIFPQERDLPEGRHQLLKEFVMTSLQDQPKARRKLPRAGVLAPALGLAAAAAVALPLLFGSAPAYAVAENPDGTVTITINEAKDPEALEAELRGMGHDFVADYLPAEQEVRHPSARRELAVEGGGPARRLPAHRRDDRLPDRPVTDQARPDRRAGVRGERQPRGGRRRGGDLGAGLRRPRGAVRPGRRRRTARRLLAEPSLRCT
ncbi:hypothetical protein ACFSTC_63115 [Nonomuraea ferruginea]